MKSSGRYDGAVLIGLSLVLVFSFVGNFFVGSRERAGNAITENSIGDGYRFFFDFKNESNKGSAIRWRRPLIEKSEFAGISSYFLLAPKRPLSHHEEKFLLAWVKEGGRLVVSFKDEAGKERIDAILASADIKAFVSEQPDFSNGQSKEVVATQSSRFTKVGEKYQFYSYLGFRDGNCLLHAETCFIREASLGKGQIIAFAGVPPFANGLIDRGDNAKLAARIAEWSGRSAIDEFHQFMTEKSLSDMAKDWSLTIPLIGFLLLTFLYFLFGNGDLLERDMRQKSPSRAISYHMLNREIVRLATHSAQGQMTEPAAWHAGVLARLLPRSRDEIRAIAVKNNSRPSVLIVRLIRFHQEWLKSRGRR